MNAQHKARLAAVLARTGTPALVTALVALEAQPSSVERNMARAWTIDELERRFPAASAAVQDAFETAERAEAAGGAYVEVDYVTVLIANIPADQR